MLIDAEPGSRPWPDLVFFLADQGREVELPHDWAYRLAVVAGLHGVRLDVRHDVAGNTRSLIKDLTSTPPEGLLVSARSVPAAADLIDSYLRARPTGFTATVGRTGSDTGPYRLGISGLGTSEAGRDGGSSQHEFDDYLIEVGWHLRDFKTSRARRRTPDPSASWKQVGPMVRDLEGDHFVLTKNATDSLTDNPYPKPARMYEHLDGLQRLAKEFHDQGGNLSTRLKEAAVAYGIEISLFDDKMPDKTVVHCGQELSTKPHVKVDDVKAAVDCGRIYFALDSKCGAFIVDHIGLHDYY